MKPYWAPTSERMRRDANVLLEVLDEATRYGPAPGLARRYRVLRSRLLRGADSSNSKLSRLLERALRATSLAVLAETSPTEIDQIRAALNTSFIEKTNYL